LAGVVGHGLGSEQRSRRGRTEKQVRPISVFFHPPASRLTRFALGYERYALRGLGPLRAD
jgi:hypothetical protein